MESPTYFSCVIINQRWQGEEAFSAKDSVLPSALSVGEKMVLSSSSLRYQTAEFVESKSFVFVFLSFLKNG